MPNATGITKAALQLLAAGVDISRAGNVLSFGRGGVFSNEEEIIHHIAATKEGAYLKRFNEKSQKDQLASISESIRTATRAYNLDGSPKDNGRLELRKTGGLTPANWNKLTEDEQVQKLADVRKKNADRASDKLGAIRAAVIEDSGPSLADYDLSLSAVDNVTKLALQLGLRPPQVAVAAVSQMVSACIHVCCMHLSNSPCFSLPTRISLHL